MLGWRLQLGTRHAPGPRTAEHRYLSCIRRYGPRPLRPGLSSGSRWNSCKQNKQGANSRPVNQTPPPEGEKLHSDSGISVDSQSLHDQQSHTQTASGQGEQGPR